MGKRLHVAKTYVVEYGNTEAFNWDYDKFYDLLRELDASPNYMCGDYDSDSTCDDFEVTREGYEKAMKNLEQYISDPTKLSDEVDADDIRQTVERLNMKPQEILDVMRDYYGEAHMADGYLHFSAW